jgi:hypothetical protein
MKIVLNIVGLVLFFFSVVWILQGTGVLPYGFMANQIVWVYHGLALEIASVAIILFANLRA